MIVDTVAREPTGAVVDRARPTPLSARENFIDRWRAAALARVVAYHTTGFGWMTVVFPAMGLMFALAGSLTARSLDRGSPAVRTRLRRLLPAFWVFGILAVPLTAWSGWGEQLDEPAERWGLLWWVLPLHAPPIGGASYAWAFSGTLWYLVAYAWFVMLSPMLLRVFRAWPLRTIGVALALPALLHVNVISVGGYFEFPIQDLVTYGACWVLGFAHHDGLLRRLPVRRFAVAVACLVLVAGAGLIQLAPVVGTADLNHLPSVNAWWSAAFVAVVLRAHRPPAAGRQASWLDRLTWAVNARAVTIYLWHFPCLLAAREIAARLGDPIWTQRLPVLAMVIALVVVVAVFLGWIEDLAAQRPAQLLPRRTWPRHEPGSVSPRGHRALVPHWAGALVAGCVVFAAATLFERWPPATEPTVSDQRQPALTVERLITEMPFTVVINGLGPAERDQSVGGTGVDDGAPIALVGTVFEHGIGVHAPSRIRVYLDRQCSRFTAAVGLDWSAGSRGSVQFVVVADGVTVYDSGSVSRRRDTRTIDVAVDGVEHLDLVVNDGGDGSDGDAANWADPRAWCTG